MFLHLGIIGFLVIGGSHGQTNCSTLRGTQGTCINVDDCSSLVKLLKESRPPPETNLESLRKSHCGFEGHIPKVCCPSESEVTAPDVTNHPNLRLLDNNLCGPITEPKLLGSSNTTVLEFPWMVLIAYVRETRPPEFRCGGSLISKRFVLTAAHCVTELDSGLRLSGVRLGEHDLSTEQDCDIENGVKIVCAEKYQDFLKIV